MSSSNINQSKPIEEYIKRADTIMDKRFLHFAFSVLGKNAEVQLGDGRKAKGKFYTASIDDGGVVVKNFIIGENANKNIPTQVLAAKDITYILISDVEEPPLIKSKKDVFKTDTEISKNKLNDQRAFVKWDAGGDDLLGSGTGMSLEESAHEKGKWNQFELNEKRFGLRSNYEENMYTTHLDMKNVSASLLEKASRLEAEILNNAADLDNRHVREERGLQELKEDDEDEEFAYSSVYRTNSKPEKKTETKADEERKPKFTNSKKQTTTSTTATQKTETLAPPAQQVLPENKKSLEVSTNARDFVPTGTTVSKPETEKTPKASELGDILQQQQQSLSRQTSNASEDPLRKKLSLNVTSGSFDTESKKDENKVAPLRQASIESETDKKANTLTPADFHPTLSAKFKLKLTEKDLKRSCVSFFDYAIPSWQKKPILNDKSADPSLINPNWKIAKSTTLRTAATPKAITPTSQPTTNASTPKPLSKPSTNAPPFNASAGGMPPNNFGGGGMMMGQPYMNPGFPQPYMNPGMNFMPQKFTPGFPMPQPNMPMYGAMPGYVDPNLPNFNMGMNYNPPHGGRQGGPQMNNRNYNNNNKNKQ